MNPELHQTLFASARASAHFALECLEPAGQHLRARGGFVTPDGTVMHWHEFGDLEGPGWAANLVGGAHLLFRWGRYLKNNQIEQQALHLLDHFLEAGFIDWQTGMITPYFDIARQRFCLNYAHNDDWLCPGSLARIGSQMIQFSEDLGDHACVPILQKAAVDLERWLSQKLSLLPNGWVPRRISLSGAAYPRTPTGGLDPIFEASADGLYLLELWSAQVSKGLVAAPEQLASQAIALGEAFIQSGGFFGSINHDTYDLNECVAYATAFRILRHAGRVFDRPEWTDFAYQVALPGLDHFRMETDQNGVATRGLLWMEKSWNTAYLWENAEAAQAYLEAWQERGQPHHLEVALDILKALALHHHGELGFLTEGVDWDNCVGRRHHINRARYGDICYTEPLLNNLHLMGPTLAYFEHIGYTPPADIDSVQAIKRVNQERRVAGLPRPGSQGVRYLLRFYYPALATDDRLLQALDFTRRSQADGVLLFEASYDMDPALLSLDELRRRFCRIQEVIPRFRQIVSEVHINMMITLGHVDAGSARPERSGFQFLVDETGRPSRSTVCPLDAGFRKHVAAQYRLAAECAADAVWVDDDTRYLWHDTAGMPCFCPLHLAAMQARTGHSWNRVELAQALQNDDLPPDLRSLWFDLQETSILELARTIEQVVHTLNPGMRIGLMTVGQSVHAAEGRRTDHLLRVLAGKTRPLIRPGSGFWNDEQPLGVFDKSEGCARELSFLGEDVSAVAEVENHPYSPYLKSERILALELALDVLAGMPDLSLNILTSMAGAGPLEPPGTGYAAFLTRQKPYLDALARQRAGMLRQGIGMVDHEDFARFTRLRGAPLSGWLQRRPWESLLARLGFPITYPDGAPNWLAGDVIRAMSDYDLDWYLREGAILDPLAVKGLLERGWGDRLGILDAKPVKDGVNEAITGDPLNGSFAGHILPAYNHISPDRLYTFEVEGQKRILSHWINVEGQDCGPGLTVLEFNRPVFSDAGPRRIVLLPYILEQPAGVLLNLPHREIWSAVLEHISGKPLPCRVTQGVNVYPLFFTAPEGRGWMLVAVNFSADDQSEVELALGVSPGNGSQLEVLDAGGQWKTSHTLSASRLRLRLPAFSLVVLRSN
jgi:hypothetical protein